MKFGLTTYVHKWKFLVYFYYMTCIYNEPNIDFIGQNEHLPFSPKLFNKMPMSWNYLAKYLYFKLHFLKI